MDFVDVKYINLISSRLQKFKKVKPHLYNFRCPICGDSKKNKHRTRAYFYTIKNNTNFKCHNCGVSISFNTFLKDFDGTLYKEYGMEKFKQTQESKSKTFVEPTTALDLLSKPVFSKKTIKLPSAFDVQKSKDYLNARSIHGGEFYYAENFKEFTNTLIPDFFEDVGYREERIVIPLIKDDKLIGFQGRAISSNPIKYLTIMLDEDEPKIYGLDKIKKDELVYVTEGPFDSTFINNAIAMCGSDVDLNGYDYSFVYIYDNEPRNREIVARIARATERQDKVVIWPDNIKEKDINDMVMSGIDVQNVIESNTYQGLQAKLKFNNWKKI